MKSKYVLIATTGSIAKINSTGSLNTYPNSISEQKTLRIWPVMCLAGDVLDSVY